MNKVPPKTFVTIKLEFDQINPQRKKKERPIYAFLPTN